MAYGADDLEAIERGIVPIGSGQRIVEVMQGNRRVTYQQSDLDKLRALRLEMIQQADSPRIRQIVVLPRL